jgi:hypothetical protein
VTHEKKLSNKLYETDTKLILFPNTRSQANYIKSTQQMRQSRNNWSISHSIFVQITKGNCSNFGISRQSEIDYEMI